MPRLSPSPRHALSATDVKLLALELRIEVLEKMCGAGPAPHMLNKSCHTPGQLEPSPLGPGAERKSSEAHVEQHLEHLECQLVGVVDEKLERCLREVESSFGATVQQYKAMLADVRASVDQRLEALRRELDMRDVLLRCAEELASIGVLMGKSETRLELLEATVGENGPPSTPRSSLRTTKTKAPSLSKDGSSQVAEAEKRRVRFTDRAPLKDSTSTPPPRGGESLQLAL